jgi:hypothetical protein
VPGGEKIWIGNVYLPPVQNMQKRGTKEEEARSYIEDIMGSIPEGTRSCMCGDWNARLGELSPSIGETQIPRKSMDKKTNSRASWVIELCE